MVDSQIKLINCDLSLIKCILNDNDSLSKKLNVHVPNNWTSTGKDVFKYALNAIKLEPESIIWWIYLSIELNTNTLIGTCGFKGKPKNRQVEIGYEVCEAFRNKGYATIMVLQLLRIAFNNSDIDSIIAHTLPEENASVKVLKKSGFKFEGVTYDDDEGKLWKWVLLKS